MFCFSVLFIIFNTVYYFLQFKKASLINFHEFSLLIINLPVVTSANNEYTAILFKQTTIHRQNMLSSTQPKNQYLIPLRVFLPMVQICW